MRLLSNPSHQSLLRLQGAAATLAILAAWIAQYGFRLYPCELCLFQRYPYYVVMLLAGLGLLIKKPNFLRIAATLAVLLFAADAGIAAYHTAVEFGLVEGPSACSAKGNAAASLEEMRRQISEAPLVSCGQAMGYVFGLSLAAWNAIFASLATVVFSLMWYRIRRPRRGW